MKAQEVIAGLAADGAEPLPTTSPAEFKATFATAVARWERFFKAHPALIDASR